MRYQVLFLLRAVVDLVVAQCSSRFCFLLSAVTGFVAVEYGIRPCSVRRYRSCSCYVRQQASSMLSTRVSLVAALLSAVVGLISLVPQQALSFQCRSRPYHLSAVVGLITLVPQQALPFQCRSRQALVLISAVIGIVAIYCGYKPFYCLVPQQALLLFLRYQAVFGAVVGLVAA